VVVETYAPARAVRSATMPWWVAGAGGAIVCAVAGWALVAALVLVAQLGATGRVDATNLRGATGAWLLGHGGVWQFGGTTITLVPLTFTAIVAIAIHGVAGYAGKQARLASPAGFSRGLAVLKVTAIVAGVYAVVVTVAAFVIDAGGPSLRAGLGALAVGVVAGFFGAKRHVPWAFQDAWPVWARAVPRAMAAGVLVALVAGVVALIAGLVARREAYQTLTDQLQPGWTGGVVLVLVQFFYSLTLILWCTSWAYGPGFTVGDGSVVSLAGSQVGLLPAFPVTAALPNGTGTAADWLWLAFPVAAGAAAAATVLRARPRARFDETALVGGLAGALSGLVVAGLALVSRGSLGVDRLAHLGPDVVPLLVIAPAIMGLGGMATGFVVGLARPAVQVDVRWWSRWGRAAATHADESTRPTQLLPRSARPKPADEQPALDFYAQEE